MAKNKISKQEKSLKEVSQEEKPLETMENPSEKLANLKSLNSLLIKETFERREQVDVLLKSKENLESEITRSAMEKKRLEVEKKLLEDQTVVAEIQHSLTLLFLSEQLIQHEEMLKNQIRIENEEMAGQLEDKNREFTHLSNNFRTYRDAVRKDLDLKQNEADLLRSVVLDLEKSNVGAHEEIRRMRMERDTVVEEKDVMERRIEAAEVAANLTKANIARKEATEDNLAPVEEKNLTAWGIDVPEDLVLDQKRTQES